MTVAGRFRGVNLDEALTAACAELRARVGELRYEVVVESAGNGVELSAEVDPVAVLGLFLSESFRAGQLDVSVQLELGDESLDEDPTPCRTLPGLQRRIGHRRCRTGADGIDPLGGGCPGEDRML